MSEPIISVVFEYVQLNAIMVHLQVGDADDQSLANQCSELLALCVMLTQGTNIGAQFVQ